jgi:hypothetical protein
MILYIVDLSTFLASSEASQLHKKVEFYTNLVSLKPLAEEELFLKTTHLSKYLW